jgi:predicted RNase H-like HicB family nuclease
LLVNNQFRGTVEITRKLGLGTSPDFPGLVAEGRSVAEAVEIAQRLARKIVESCLEHGDPLPRVFRNKQRPNQEFRVPVSVS